MGKHERRAARPHAVAPQEYELHDRGDFDRIQALRWLVIIRVQVTDDEISQQFVEDRGQQRAAELRTQPLE
jgi:hypothetical protein